MNLGGLSHPSSTGGQAVASSAVAAPNKSAYGTVPKSGHGPAPIYGEGKLWSMNRLGIDYDQLRGLGKTLDPKGNVK